MDSSNIPDTTPVPDERAESHVVPVRREKKAKRSVLIADKIADKTITIGGILVIIAVLGILVFLIAETLPLFQGGIITERHDYTLEGTRESVLSVAMDEYKTFILEFTEEGDVLLLHAKTGKHLVAPKLDSHGKAVTSFSDTLDRRDMAFGFADGTIQFVTVLFKTETITADDLPSGLTELDERDATDGETVYSRIPGNQYRTISVDFEWETPLLISESGNPIVALDYRISGEAERQTKAFVAIDSEGIATLNLANTKINLLTGEKRTTVKRVQLPPFPENLSLHSVILTEKADTVLIADRRGILYRYNTSDLSAPLLAERHRVLPRGTNLTIFDLLLGGQSIVVGGSDGSLSIYFLVDDENANTSDGQLLVRAREFDSLGSAAVLFDASQRGKSFAVADTEGNLRVLHGTSQKTLMSFPRDN
jgi:phosphate transport system permease protein